ncbi:hypothetical protein EDD15DRAFT_2200738 [Pisolithus albus]|nr:hypothetical protein EDD15DRAFT_2200738 [Pisolithus albus]
MPAHSPSKGGARSRKQHGEDTGRAVTQKKQKGSVPAQPTSSTSERTGLRRSGRTGAGVGGQLDQLERIGAVIEGSQRTSRATTTLSNDTMPNPVAPTQMSRGTGRRKQAEQPPPYVSDVPSSGRSHVKGKGAYGLAQGDTAPAPSFHSQMVDGRFGFHEPTHLVPPGSEPDLRALNNPYVAERTVEGHRSTTSQNQRPVSTGSGVSDLAHQLPRLTCNGRSSSSLSASRPLDFEQHLDPSLRDPTAPRKARPNRNDDSEGECVDEDGFWQGYHGKDEDNLNDKASEESDDEVSGLRVRAIM